MKLDEKYENIWQANTSQVFAHKSQDCTHITYHITGFADGSNDQGGRPLSAITEDG